MHTYIGKSRDDLVGMLNAQLQHDNLTRSQSNLLFKKKKSKIKGMELNQCTPTSLTPSLSSLRPATITGKLTAMYGEKDSFKIAGKKD